MIRCAFFAIAALALTDVRAQTYDISNLTVTNMYGRTDVFNGSFLYSEGQISDVSLSPQEGMGFMNTGAAEGRKGALFSLSDGSPPGIGERTLALRPSAPSITDSPATVHAAPELHGTAAAVAALTLLLGGVAVLKGRPRA
jgi:hypothetical protein